jgi:glycosyltransferase involved in cell wall biosynthesis
MRVAMDATPAVAGRTGIARYVLDLAAALPEHDVEPRLFAVGRASVPPPPGCRHLRIPSRIVHRAWAARLPPSAERIAGPVDVVHATSLLPPTTRRPLVMTVHDLDAIDHADLHPDRSTRAVRSLVQHLDLADVVLAVSQATADDLVERGVDRDRIVVTPNGRVELGAPTASRVQEGPYVLAVGEQMPRKNLATLLRVWAQAPELPPLVHAGPPGSDTARLEVLVQELGLGDRVRFLGYVGVDVLARLLLDARALAFPSTAEGFGLPVLEAMAAELPVVASDLAVLREVTGGHALLVPAHDVDAWTDALSRAVDDEALRRGLVEPARAQAATYTWARCAALTAAAYRRALP